MNVDIYRLTPTRFLSVPHGTPIGRLALTSSSKELVKSASLVRTVDLDDGVERVSLDDVDIRRQIESRGFALHGATVNFRDMA